MSPQEALDAIQSRLETYENGMNQSVSPEMEVAIATLDAFITQVSEHGSEDLEWGEPGDCDERLRDDPYLQLIEEGGGRHYGLPHCIWCLEAT